MSRSDLADEHARAPGVRGAEQSLPASVALAWGLRGRGTRGPKPGLTLEQIAQAGIELAGADGIEAVSMARVAAALGAGTMSLYRYVSSKEELLALMIDTALGAPQPPAQVRRAGWRAGLEWWVRSVRDAYGRHPWALKVPITEPPLAPNNVAWMEVALEAMAATPLSEPEKLSTLLLISGFARNTATLSADITAARPARAATPTYGRMLAALTDQQRFPAVHRAIASGTFDDDEEDFETPFEYGLERILDGVEALIRGRG